MFINSSRKYEGRISRKLESRPRRCLFSINHTISLDHFLRVFWLLSHCRLAGSFILHVLRPHLPRLYAKMRWIFACFHFFKLFWRKTNEKKEIYRESVTVKHRQFMGQGAIWEMKNATQIIYRLCIAKCFVLKQTQYPLCVSWAPQNDTKSVKLNHMLGMHQTSTGGSFQRDHFLWDFWWFETGANAGWCVTEGVNHEKS